MPIRIKNPILQKKISEAPQLPGCYIYRDKNKVVLYVGKALNLRNRVKSYFADFDNHIQRTKNLVRRIDDVEFVIADFDEEAFILETNLIRKYKPKFNLDKKDDKNYSWVMLDKKEDYPRIQMVRKQSNKNAEYFGPYATQGAVKRTLISLRKLFAYRSCQREIKLVDGKLHSSNIKPCLYYYLGLCQAPCTGLIKRTEYRKGIRKIKYFFEGKRQDMLNEMKAEMFNFSKELNYEKAAEVRNKITDLAYLAQRVDVGESTDEVKFRQVKRQNQSMALVDIIDIIGDARLSLHSGFKIECYDISNIQGTHAVGSMIVFVDGVPEKSLYRKFKIKIQGTPDDFAMHREVQQRRMQRYLDYTQGKHNDRKTDQSFAKLPDLIIIDGGKGQLSATAKTLREMSIDVPIAGLAKRFEDLFIMDESGGELRFVKKTLPVGSQARFLMQRVRDEAHRFAINYHRKLRDEAVSFSLLDEIPGVGETIKTKLLRAFGSVDEIAKADEKALLQVIKNKLTAKKILEVLHK